MSHSVLTALRPAPRPACRVFPSGPQHPSSASSLPHSGPQLSMEQLLRAQLHTKTLRAFGSSGGGCISEGYAYYTDTGPVFVKVNRRAQVRCWVYKD